MTTAKHAFEVIALENSGAALTKEVTRLQAKIERTNREVSEVSTR